MKRTPISSTTGPQPEGNYCQATEIAEFNRILYISGQIPVGRDGSVPATFTAQCHRVWDNIEAQLSAADMDHENIVKITTFLSDRKYAEENSAVRQERLGNLKQALTVIITEIYDSDWLLEIEAVAAE